MSIIHLFALTLVHLGCSFACYTLQYFISDHSTSGTGTIQPSTIYHMVRTLTSKQFYYQVFLVRRVARHPVGLKTSPVKGEINLPVESATI